MKFCVIKNVPFYILPFYEWYRLRDATLWPQDMYANMTRLFPPDKAFSNYAAKIKTCNLHGCRYAMDIGAIIGNNAKAGGRGGRGGRRELNAF